MAKLYYMAKAIGLTLLMSILGVLVYAAVFRLAWSPIQVTKETTWIVSPLDEDGLPDYAKHLLPVSRPEMDSSTNAAIPFYQSLWPAVDKNEYQKQHRKLLLEELGCESFPNRSEDFDIASKEVWNEYFGQLSREAFRVDAELSNANSWRKKDARNAKLASRLKKLKAPQNIEKVIDIITRQPWNSSSLPFLSKWIQKHADDYELLYEAARRNDFHPSIVYLEKCALSEISLIHLFTLKKSTNNLLARAMLRLSEGELQKAIGDTGVLSALLNQFHPLTTAEQSHKRVLIRKVIAASVAILSSEKCSIQDIECLVTAIDSLSQPTDWATLIDQSDRAMVLDSILAFAGRNRGKKSGSNSSFAMVELIYPIDWNYPLRSMNQEYDKLVAVARLPLTEQLVAIAKWKEEQGLLETEELENLSNSKWPEERGKYVFESILKGLLFDIEKNTLEELRFENEKDLFRIACQALEYRIQVGQYPESLDTLNKAVPLARERDANLGAVNYALTNDGIKLSVERKPATDIQTDSDKDTYWASLAIPIVPIEYALPTMNNSQADMEEDANRE